MSPSAAWAGSGNGEQQGSGQTSRDSASTLAYRQLRRNALSVRRVTVTGIEIYSRVTSIAWAPLRRCGRCSTVAIRRPATGSAGGCRSPATSRSTTCRWRSTASACSRGRASCPREGDTAIGYPVEYGGKGSPGAQRDRVRDARDGRPVAAGQVRRAVRPLRRRDPAPRHRAPPRALPARRRLARAARLLRDDRDRPRLQRPGAARRPRPTTPRARSSSSTRPTTTRARTTSATPRATGAWPSSSRSCIAGGEERGVHALLVPIRDEDGDAAARRPDRGLRRQARPQRRRQRAHLVRPRARPAREPARPLRAGRARRHLLQPDREPDQALLHDARHADPGPRQRLRRVDQRVQGRADDRRPARAGAAPVRPARAARRRC